VAGLSSGSVVPSTNPESWTSATTECSTCVPI